MSQTHVTDHTGLLDDSSQVPATCPTYMSQVYDALGGDGFLTSVLSSSYRRGAVEPSGLSSWTSLAEFEAAVAGGRHRFPRIRMFRAGTPVPEDSYTVAATTRLAGAGERMIDDLAVARLLQQGASLILDSVEEAIPDVRRAQEFLEYRVREPVQVNGFLTWGSDSGVGAHWDDHDVVVVQAHGRKRWRVLGPGPGQRPMFKDHDARFEEPPACVVDIELEAGDVLYVPRGWWHDVHGLGECSLHLTFAFVRPTVLDAARQFIERLSSEEFFRAELDLFDWPALERQGQEFRDHVVASFASMSLEHLVVARTVGATRRRGLSLPWKVSWSGPDPSWVRFAGRTPPVVGVSDGGVTVRAVGGRFSLDTAVAPLLALLATGETWSVEQLPRILSVSRGELLTHLRTLLDADLVILE